MIHIILANIHIPSYFLLSMQDRHGKGNMKPVKDPEQNWKLIFAEEDATSTVLVFTRPLRSCDTENDLNIKVIVFTSITTCVWNKIA